MFSDTEAFDQQLTGLMKQRQQQIDIRFYGSVSINHLPKRLQSWLAKVDRYGNGHRINPQSTSGYVPKNIGVALSLLIRAVPFVSNHYRNDLASHYGAVITLKADSDSIEKLAFHYEPKPEPVDTLIDKSAK